MPPRRDGSNGWRELLGGNVLWLSLASLLNDASSEMIFPLLPLFLVGTLGAGPAFLGLIEGVAETTAAFFKLGGGWLSDRAGRRRGLVSGGYALAAVTRPLLAAVTLPWHVLALRFTDRVGKGVRTAPRDALLAESVTPRLRGRAFGAHRAADHAGALIGPLIASGLLLLWPGRLRLVFLLAVLPAAAAALLVAARVTEIRPAPGPAAARRESAPRDHAPRATTGGSRGPVGSRTAEPSTPGPTGLPDGLDGDSFRGYLAVLALFTLGNASDAFLLLRAQDVGVGVALIPVLWATLHVSKMAWNLLGGALADSVGPRPTILAGWLVYAATYAGFALASEPWHIWTLFLVYGLFHGLTEPTEKALVAALSSAADRARAFGAYHFAIGIAALPASLIFGALWETRGPAAAFFLGGGLALCAAALLPVVVRSAPPTPRP